MKQRDYGYYIDKAKAYQGFKYDNQVDAALSFKGSMTTMLRQNKRHLSDQKMMELAILGGIDPAVALMDLGALKAETPELKKHYTEILKRISALTVALLILLSPAPSKAQPLFQPLGANSFNQSDFIHYHILAKALAAKIRRWIKGLFTARPPLSPLAVS